MKKQIALGIMAAVCAAGPLLAVPPVDVNFGALWTTGAYRSADNSLGATQVRWYRFSTPGCAAADNTYLDIDTNTNPTIAGTPIVDTEIALYDTTGALVSTDDDSGSGSGFRRSQLSFGAGGRPGVGGSAAFSGYSGATLAAGEYFIVVGAFNTEFNATGFSVNALSSTTGTYRIEARSGRMPSATPPVTAADLGNLRGVNSQGVTADLPTAGSNVVWVKFHLDFATSAAGYYCDLHTAGSSLPGSLSNQDTVLALFNAAGAPVAGGLSDDYAQNFSALSYGRTAGPRAYGVITGLAGQNGAAIGPGDYYAAMCRFGYQNPAAGFVFGSTGTEPGGTLKLTVATNMPPVPDYDMGIIKSLNSLASTPNLPLPLNEVRWITFRTEAATSAASVYCDIHTLGSRLNSGGFQGNDTTIGLYAADGSVIAVRDDYNSLYSALSFGRTSGPRSYTEGADTLNNFNGFTGAVLPAGQYYVAVLGFGSYNFQPNFRASTDTSYVGTVRLNVATNMGAGLDVDLGIVNASNSPRATPQLAIAANQVKWVHFKTERPTGAGTFYVDMHTLGSVLTPAPNDTVMGLYSKTGVLISYSDDVGPVGESALSYGLVAPGRNYSAPIGTLSGGTAAVLPADDYYVAVACFSLSALGNDFGFVGGSTRVGVVQLTVLSNIPLPGCNAADVAGLGGSIGPDGALTVDDIIVYLNAFFGNVLAVADLVTIGGNPPPDGVLTPDDLIYFLAQFFSPCNP